MKLRLVLSVLVVFCLLSLRPALARTWTDSSGTHKVEAELVKLDGEIVHLKKADGTIIKVTLDRLCPDDQKFVRQQMATSLLSLTRKRNLKPNLPQTTRCRSETLRQEPQLTRHSKRRSKSKSWQQSGKNWSNFKRIWSG